MYDNRPTVQTESLRRVTERREESRRRAARNKRYLRAAVRIALVVAVAAIIYLNR